MWTSHYYNLASKSTFQSLARLLKKLCFNQGCDLCVEALKACRVIQEDFCEAHIEACVYDICCDVRGLANRPYNVIKKPVRWFGCELNTANPVLYIGHT